MKRRKPIHNATKREARTANSIKMELKTKIILKWQKIISSNITGSLHQEGPVVMKFIPLTVSLGTIDNQSNNKNTVKTLLKS